MDMTRRCLTEGCERKPVPGWARCAEHLVEWLNRLGLSTRQGIRDKLPVPFASGTADYPPGEAAEAFGR
jgi:hypothetical protein